MRRGAHARRRFKWPSRRNGVARDDKGAKREEKGADENYEFIPAEFDEDAFIHKEMVSFRTTTILFLWGIVAALVSWGLFAAVEGAKVGWLIGLLVATVFGVSLKWLYPRLKADIKHFGRREWLGTGFLFFFTWLAFFIIAINPPLSDFAAPRVDVLVGPPIQQAGGQVTLNVFYEDNHRVDAHTFTLEGPDGVVNVALQDLGRGHFQGTTTALPVGIYTATATATDAKGHTQETVTSFVVVETVITVSPPDGNLMDSVQDVIVVQVAGDLPPCKSTKGGGVREEPCLRTVELVLTSGSRVALVHASANKIPCPVADGWCATTDFAGWQSGNLTFDVHAEIRGTYAGNSFVEGGVITDGPYNLRVTAPLGDTTYKVVNQPSAPVRSVPGIEPALLVVGLLGVVAVLRRR